MYFEEVLHPCRKNEINRKTRKLLGQDMVTEPWLCVEVLSQLEDFTADQVEDALPWIFGDKSKKEVDLMDKTQAIMANNVRVKQGTKRKPSGNEAKHACFYCFKADHFKSDCPTKAADRNPNRTDAHTAPGAKRTKKGNSTAINMVKTVVADGEPRLNRRGNTVLE
ncbi:hypothetical protein PHMEG_00035641 [Phytophthora megakarya]|uniref:CCHC-type domain-containing protein n=1 Tax=Phytophthora megakarya TaxID=4795 RepID=A0A225UN86_9STRA|nr:hypothetical protein PHMEG_00035641 [Phytophthora megakarya]